MALVMVFAAPASAYPQPGHTERVSVASDGSEGDHISFYPVFSDDGRYVAFASLASNFEPEEGNQGADVFLRDRVTGVTTRISQAADGSPGDGPSNFPSITPDGRYVAFHSSARNLVPEAANQWQHIYVYDREADTLERVSLDSEGTPGNGASERAAISADGRYVAFQSLSTNLVPGGGNGWDQVYVHDRKTGETELVSVSSDGTMANWWAVWATISDDGRQVAFGSPATNLIAGGTTNRPNVYVHDRETGETELVSVSSDGAHGNGNSNFPAISGDGRYVAFSSLATNFVPNDTNDRADAFVHDRETGVTERVSISSSGVGGNDSTYMPFISRDGRHVAFYSYSTNLVERENPDCDGPFGPTLCSDVFVHDRLSGVTERVSEADDGTDADDASYARFISGDGGFVGFESPASNLVPGTTNDTLDAYMRRRGPAVGVGELSVTLAEDEVAVAGWARFSGAVVTAAEKPDGDLTGARIVLRPELEDLLVVLTLDHVEGPECSDLACEWGGGALGVIAPGVLHQRTLYTVGFDLGGVRYEVRVWSGSKVRTAVTDLSDGPHFTLYRCDPECSEEAELTGGIGDAGPEVRISVPLAELGASAGTALTGIHAAGARENPLGNEPLDELDLPDATLPSKHVTLGIAPIKTKLDDVAFEAPATLVDGRFSGTADTSSLPGGEYHLWVRACLGAICKDTAAAMTVPEI